MHTHKKMTILILNSLQQKPSSTCHSRTSTVFLLQANGMNFAKVANHLLVGKICCKSPGSGQGGVQSQSLYPGELDSHLPSSSPLSDHHFTFE